MSDAFMWLSQCFLFDWWNAGEGYLWLVMLCFMFVCNVCLEKWKRKIYVCFILCCDDWIHFYDFPMIKLSYFKIATKAFRDPLLSQGRERSAEERTILRCLTGNEYTDKDIEQVKLPPLPLVPLGRHGTDSVRWLEMPLHNIESTPRMASRSVLSEAYQCIRVWRLRAIHFDTVNLAVKTTLALSWSIKCSVNVFCKTAFLTLSKFTHLNNIRQNKHI